MGLSDISLSAGMRSNLKSLQSITSLLDRTGQRLSTGKKVNTSLDNPTNFFAAQEHIQRATDLSVRKDGMLEAIQGVSAANKGITAISGLIDAAKGLIQSARSADAAGRTSLSQQFNGIRAQIDMLAADSGYKGKNFLLGDTLNVLFNENGGASLTISGFQATSSGLGIDSSIGLTSTTVSMGISPASSSILVTPGIPVGNGIETIAIGIHAATWVSGGSSSGGLTKVVAGYDHSLAITSGGSVIAWGNSANGRTTVPAGALSGIVAVAAGGMHSLALNSSGAVIAWGDNSLGQTTVPAAAQSGVTAISAGYDYSLALKNDGTVVAWGNPANSQTAVPAGLSGVIAISADVGIGVPGQNHSLALTSSGIVYGWGYNASGEATPPAGLSGVIAVAAGGSHSLALKGDGTVVAWGSNSWGQTTVPAGLSGVVAIAAAGDYSLALKSDGTVVGWGNNSWGNVPASGQSGVTSIAAGFFFAAVQKSDGSVVPWGINIQGELNVPVVSGSSAASVFQLAVNDVATGLTILSGGPMIYVSGAPAPPPPYALSGAFITINDSGVSSGAVTYSYNVGFTGSSSGIVTTKTASFPLTPPLAARESVAAVYVSGVPLPASGYSASSTAITFEPGYEPASGQAITADIATAWLSSFRIDPALTNGQTVSGVYIDGVQVPSSGYFVRPPDAIDFFFAHAPLSGQAVSAGINTVAITSLWLSDNGLDTASSQLDRAVKTLRAESAALASNLSVVTIRQGFTQGMIDTLQKGADDLTLADMNEEGANMLMLQTRQQLGTTSLSMSSQSARSIQSLFE